MDTNDKVINIKVKEIDPVGRHPEDILSNLCNNDFCLDGVHCGCMEAFLQSLKTNDLKRQILVCSLSKKEAKMRSTETWKKEQTVYWKGRSFNRHGNQFQFLLRRAYRAMMKQCPGFYEALKATNDKRLFHSIGNPNPKDTILTEKELCDILTELRSEIQTR